ncbi:expressed unknown protein [Seminavis robusta]|uniref:Uncharacterized protein n=1 Tax=Seminavis robusta TaxID=568900 RepID=A0A9N8HMT3_9STRA|nr:expressed unknown protein [Seminavis robusta]|eukprot:Sro926_g221030.1 n/a (267) ;mRNA; r:21732-22647
MVSSVFLTWSLGILLVAHRVSAWTIPTRYSVKTTLAATADSNEEDDTLASVYSRAVDDEPYAYFQMQKIPTDAIPMAGSASRLDHVVDCAEHGECNVEEMMNMIDELERLNEECTSETSGSRECQLDTVAARNVLKVALASKVMMEDVMRFQETSEQEDPYASMMDMEDEYHDSTMQEIPTAALQEADLDRIVQCAEDGECDVGEMTDMIEELERLNLDCEGTISRECSLDARAARNILKVALASQAAMAKQMSQETRGERRGPTP